MKIKNEKETRQIYIDLGRKHGLDADVTRIFARYDNIFKGCGSKEERSQIAAMCAAELHKLFGFHDGLMVDNKLVLPPK